MSVVRLATFTLCTAAAGCSAEGPRATGAADASTASGDARGGALGGTAGRGSLGGAGGAAHAGTAGATAVVDAGGAAGAGGGGGAVTGPPDAGPPPPPRRAACPSGQGQGDPLRGARAATVLRRGFGFVEGPLWLAGRGVLVFSDMDFGGGDAQGPPSVIREMELLGATFRVATSSGSNGLALANDGRIIAATHDVQSLSYFDATTFARTDWALRRGTARFNSPNDLVVRGDGNVYFTDPDWQLGSRTSETGVEGIYRVAPSGLVEPVDDGFDKPNGITLSPDEATLYVGGRSGGIFRYSLDPAGAASQKTLFAPGSTDGMTVDCAGNVYTTSGDVIVFDRAGVEVGRVTTDRSPSNVAFGGPDGRTLFITGGDTLFSVDLAVPGMPY